MSDKKLAGVWMDGKRAIIVANHDGQEVGEFEVVGSAKLEIQKGNSNENAAHNAEITNKTKFFKEIEHKITNTVKLLVTGHGVMPEEFKHHLHGTAQYKNLDVVVEATGEHMSDEQFLTHVKEKFNA